VKVETLHTLYTVPCQKENIKRHGLLFNPLSRVLVRVVHELGLVYVLYTTRLDLQVDNLLEACVSMPQYIIRVS